MLLDNNNCPAMLGEAVVYDRLMMWRRKQTLIKSNISDSIIFKTVVFNVSFFK